MKICFLLQSRFAHVGHAMALALKNRYGVSDFCGYVYSRSSMEFLTSQKEITYTKLLLDEEVHERYKNEPLDLSYLKLLEQEYGIPNLWPFIEIDRVLRYGLFVREYPHDTSSYTHKELLRLTQVYAKAITRFLDEEKPDVLIFAVIGTLSTMLLYHIAKKRGIKTLFISTARIENQYTVTEDYKDLTYTQETFHALEKGTVHLPEFEEKARHFLRTFQKAPAPYNPNDTAMSRPTNRGRQFNFLSPKRLSHTLLWLVKPWWIYMRNRHKSDYTVIKPWHLIGDRLMRKMRVLRGYDDLYDKPNWSEVYAFFPLQLEPEISHSLFAPFYTDYLWLAKQIAKSLPIDHTLYVKEHPAMFGYRTRRFYKELKKIPNLKLIQPTTTVFDLLSHAKLVVATTSTSAWEAVLLKKPAITLGDVFFNVLPMVKKCNAIQDLPKLIREHPTKFVYDEQSLIQMIAAIYKESASMDLVQIWDIEGASDMNKIKKETAPFVDYLAVKLGLRPLQK